jgi:hypothetical protein
MAKRKKSIISRKVAKNNQIYYFENGKRLTEKAGAAKFVKTFFSQIDPAKLSPQEAKSYRGKTSAQKSKAVIKEQASQRLRFKGRFVPKYLQRLLVEQKLIDPKEREIQREYTEAKNYGDFLKEIKSLVPKTAFLRQSEWGLPSAKRERTTFESVIDIVETIESDPLFSSLELNVIDEKGKLITNRVKALETIRDWEIQTLNDIMEVGGNPAYTKFSHYGNINIENGTLTIDLNESNEDTNFSV